MFLQHIKLSGIRNLNSAFLNFSPQFNLFYGKNGSGKTSVLEAIHLLAAGRSFRSSSAHEFVSFGLTSCVLSGKTIQRAKPELNTFHLGVERHLEEGLTLRVNQEKGPSMGEFAQILPIQLINTDAYQLLEGSSRFRRQFIDWTLFHVEHSFFPLWQRYTRALKQRNAALKRVKFEGKPSVSAWDKELADCGEALDSLRSGFLSNFKPILDQVLKDFVQCQTLELVYKRGWSQDLLLEAALNVGFEQDALRGFTQAGAHRADVEFRLGPSHVDSVFSRGQQKLLIAALMIARGQWLLEQTGRCCVYLVDDLGSELDQDSSLWLLSRLKEMGGQVLLTSIEPELVSKFMEEKGEGHEFKMFHVEHGVVREQAF